MISLICQIETVETLFIMHLACIYEKPPRTECSNNALATLFRVCYIMIYIIYIYTPRYMIPLMRTINQVIAVRYLVTSK